MYFQIEFPTELRSMIIDAFLIRAEPSPFLIEGFEVHWGVQKLNKKDFHTPNRTM